MVNFTDDQLERFSSKLRGLRLTRYTPSSNAEDAITADGTIDASMLPEHSYGQQFLGRFDVRLRGLQLRQNADDPKGQVTVQMHGTGYLELSLLIANTYPIKPKRGINDVSGYVRYTRGVGLTGYSSYDLRYQSGKLASSEAMNANKAIIKDQLAALADLLTPATLKEDLERRGKQRELAARQRSMEAAKAAWEAARDVYLSYLDQIGNDQQ